ncbi:MAG TPA: FxLYD domain-containing protein [Pyrinomonadaceae bacterium]|nr:FxLYD domain-containing protein [Pyrinomonadaceae bacterium]
MRIRVLLTCLALSACGALSARAQQTNATQDNGMEQRAPLEGQPVALDSLGRAAIAGQLLTRALSGTPDAPVKNARFIVENRSASFYTYVTGSVTFYDERGVRCGEGQFTVNALAPGEQAETDAPGLRLSCAPRTWRIVANNLLTRTSDRAVPVAESPAQPEPPATTSEPAVLMPLEIVVDDRVYNAPLGSTLEVPVRKRRVKITVRAAP